LASCSRRVFNAGSRKIILATNIAETSLTIVGVRFVVDTGLSKQRAFNPRSGVDTLAVAPISRAAARQRAGRAGREAPGKCFRLYTEESFHALAPATRPEILRANLGGVVLQLKALGVGDVLEFPLLDPPPRAALLRSLELLYALAALNDAGELTKTGTTMARFPLEPMVRVPVACMMSSASL
jgi:ATP-dependent RNA helicase DHX8/PRP22